MDLLQSLLQTVLPVFVMAGAGALARRFLDIDPRQVSRVAIYVFVPALAFDSIYTTTLPAAEVARITLFMAGITLIMTALTWLTGKTLRWSEPQIYGAALATVFFNGANYGLPVTYFAWGDAGVERATLLAVWSSVLMYTLGVFFAARGRLDWRRSVAAVFKLPLIWAALAALLARWSGLPMPVPILKAARVLSQGAVPIVVVLLGLQVVGIRLRGARLHIGVATFLRLVVSPLAAMGLVALLKPDPLTAKVLVLIAAMPSAVNTLLLSLEFDAEPEMVSGIALVSTLLSLATVSFWVSYL